MPSIEDVEQTNAFGHLFNGLTRMSLREGDTGYPIFFSRRREWTRRFVGMLLEAGLVPESLLEQTKFEFDQLTKLYAGALEEEEVAG